MGLLDIVKHFFKPDIHLNAIEYEAYLKIVAYLNDKEIGVMKCIINDVEKTILIGDIVISKYIRNNGIGTMMINELFKYAACHNIKKIIGNLSTVDDKKLLIHFYEKLGFKIEYLNHTKGDNTFAVIEKYITIHSEEN